MTPFLRESHINQLWYPGVVPWHVRRPGCESCGLAWSSQVATSLVIPSSRVVLAKERLVNSALERGARVMEALAMEKRVPPIDKFARLLK